MPNRHGRQTMFAICECQLNDAELFLTFVRQISTADAELLDRTTSLACKSWARQQF